jgi:transposase, IS5 family
VKGSKAKPAADGSPRVDRARLAFGSTNHVAIDRRRGLIRTWTATDAARHDGAQLLRLVLKANTASDVWADTAYRSEADVQHLTDLGFVSRTHRKTPPGRPMPVNIGRANGTKSKIRAKIEPVFAEQKSRMALFIRTVGIDRARTNTGLANPGYNVERLIVLKRWAAPVTE